MQKEINRYAVKAQNIEIKDFDENSRKVSMYLARFNILDSDNDIILPGAFKRSIKERGPNSASNRKIAYLRYHDWEKPIGKFLELSEDENGLLAVAQLGNSEDGADALNDYKDGIIREHSIGFRYIKDQLEFVPAPENEGPGHFNVKEVALWEGSAVTFGANEFTNVIEVAKSENKLPFIQKLGEQIEVMTKAIISGQGSDERQYSLEMKLKYLNAQLLSIAKADPFNKHSAEFDPSNRHSNNNNQQEQKAFNWIEVYNKF